MLDARLFSTCSPTRKSNWQGEWLHWLPDSLTHLHRLSGVRHQRLPRSRARTRASPLASQLSYLACCRCAAARGMFWSKFINSKLSEQMVKQRYASLIFQTARHSYLLYLFFSIFIICLFCELIFYIPMFVWVDEWVPNLMYAFAVVVAIFWCTRKL